MPHQHQDALITCPRPWRTQALQQLAAADTPDGLAELVAAINHASTLPEQSAWDGLLVIATAQRPEAAVWLQPQPGRTARLWPPATHSKKAPELLQAARRWAAKRDLTIVQAVIDSADHQAARLLKENGFPRLVDLLYLSIQPTAARCRANPSRPSRTSQIAFDSIGSLPSPRLVDIMHQIEDRSMDCPGLHGVLAPEQAIEGFRHQGPFLPEHWCILRFKDEDAGALLMTIHPTIGCWELMYMGVVHRYRGQGLGKILLKEALQRARQASANLLLLTVDTNNQPAIRLYEQAGFQTYAERSLYAYLSA